MLAGTFHVILFPTFDGFGARAFAYVVARYVRSLHLFELVCDDLMSTMHDVDEVMLNFRLCDVNQVIKMV